MSISKFTWRLDWKGRGSNALSMMSEMAQNSVVYYTEAFRLLAEVKCELGWEIWAWSRLKQKWVLHPLIHTPLEFTLTQDWGLSQRCYDLVSELPQTGHPLSSGLAIAVSLHFGHLTGWTFTCLISLGSSNVVISNFGLAFWCRAKLH